MFLICLLGLRCVPKRDSPTATCRRAYRHDLPDSQRQARRQKPGAALTVEQVGKTAMLEEDAVWCVWFEKVGNKQVARKDTFAPVVLEKAEKPRAAFSVGVVRA